MRYQVSAPVSVVGADVRLLSQMTEACHSVTAGKLRYRSGHIETSSAVDHMMHCMLNHLGYRM